MLCLRVFVHAEWHHGRSHRPTVSGASTVLRASAREGGQHTRPTNVCSLSAPCIIPRRDFAARFFPDTLNPPAESSPFCQFNDHVMQLFVSSLFLAGAAAALAGMFTSRRWGRKPTMVLGGLCFLIGTVLVASAFETAQLVVGRVVLGFGVGFATQATPLYLSEMVSHAHGRASRSANCLASLHR